MTRFGKVGQGRLKIWERRTASKGDFNFEKIMCEVEMCLIEVDI